MKNADDKLKFIWNEKKENEEKKNKEKCKCFSNLNCVFFE